MTDLTLPMTRQRPLDPPDEVAELRRQAAMHRMTYADGHRGWLVTGYAAARAVLADPRFSNRPENLHSPIPSRVELTRNAREPGASGEAFHVPRGFFLRTDAPEHTRYRKLLTGQFTVRRMKLLRQIMVMYVAGRPALITHISSGSGVPYCETTVWQGKQQRFCGSARTPTGNYRTTWRKSGWHKSYLGELYNPIFFNGGIAFHGALSVPLYPASHGCVRMPMNVAEELPRLLGANVPVHVRGAFRR